MEMTTSLSSRSLACSSYSIVTSQSSPFSFGQQLTEKKNEWNLVYLVGCDMFNPGLINKSSFYGLTIL